MYQTQQLCNNCQLKYILFQFVPDSNNDGHCMYRLFRHAFWLQGLVFHKGSAPCRMPANQRVNPEPVRHRESVHMYRSPVYNLNIQFACGTCELTQHAAHAVNQSRVRVPDAFRAVPGWQAKAGRRIIVPGKQYHKEGHQQRM